jgi:plasmid maintenance system antidote protein VapI
MSEEFKPNWRSPPGDTIRELMDDHQMSPLILSMHLDKSLYWTIRFLNGKEDLTRDIAEKLEKLFGAPGPFWLRREAHYREPLED